MLDLISQKEYECKKCMDKILEFIRLINYGNYTDNIMKATFTTKDYDLVQWIDWLKKQVPKWTKLYDFQAFIGEWIRVLDSNNKKWRKKKW